MRWEQLAGEDRQNRGLALVDALISERAPRFHPPLPAVRGDPLAKLGRDEEARAEFTRAASLTRDEAERTLFRSSAEEF